ncbi:10649_t:CDS:2, partial [Rhizophagus irregularis]
AYKRQQFWLQSAHKSTTAIEKMKYGLTNRRRTFLDEDMRKPPLGNANKTSLLTKEHRIFEIRRKWKALKEFK